MFKYFGIKNYIIIGILSLLSAGWLVKNVSIFPYQLTIEMKSNSNGQMQIYYANEHSSFNEPNSFLIPVKKSTGFESYSIYLHKKNIRNLKIDPVGDFQIKSIKIHNRFHSYTHEKSELLKLIGPSHNIEGFALIHNDYVEGVDNDEIDFGTGDFSIVTRFTTSDDISGTILCKINTNTGYGLGVSSGILTPFISGAAGPASSINTGYVLSENTGYLIAVVVEDNQIVSTYVNSILEHTFDNGTPFGSVDNTATIKFGYGGGAMSGYYSGTIANVYLYNKALTASEVKQLTLNPEAAEFKYKGAGSQTDIPGTFIIHKGSPGISGDTITFSNEVSCVKQLNYWKKGKVYKINCTVSSYTGSGAILLPYDGNNSPPEARKSGNGTFEYNYTPNGSAMYIYSLAGHTATVTVNSITKIGYTAMYKPNEMSPSTYLYDQSEINNSGSPNSGTVDYVEGHVVGKHPSFQLLLQQPVNQLSSLFRVIYVLVSALIFFVVFLFLYLLYARHKDWLTNAVDIAISRKLFLLLVCCIFAWLAFQNIYYATTIKWGISPDETHHLTVSKLYANLGTFFIKDSAEPIPGISDCKLSEQPYFYHLLLGKTLLLNFFSITDYLLLRFVNIIISILSLYFTLLLVKEITKNRWIQLTVLVVQTNILMYVFLSSMISYDNLCNLLSVLSFLFLLRYLKFYSRTQLILLLLTLSIGTLTKNNFLPVVVVQVTILLWYSKAIFKHRHRLFNKSISIREIILLLMLISFFILNLKLWVGNPDLIRRLNSLTSQPIPLDEVNKHNPQTCQGRGLLTIQTSQVSTVNIVKSDMSGALNRLKLGIDRALNLLKPGKNRGAHSVVVQRSKMSLYETIPHYLIRTEETIFGIMAHKNLLRKNNDLLLYRTLFFLSILLFIMNFRKRIKNSKLCIIAASVLMYMVIVFYVNYTGYLVSGHFGAALHGRYNFPILVLLIIFLVYNVLINFNDRIKILFLLLITPLLIYNNYFWFIMNVTPDWFITP
ncbi:MAG: LamG domain-containing protein [Bacteroidales bacterium]|nr:LamG domain-containing protein [Bacteroidales bacterium]